MWPVWFWKYLEILGAHLKPSINVTSGFAPCYTFAWCYIWYWSSNILAHWSSYGPIIVTALTRNAFIFTWNCYIYTFSLKRTCLKNMEFLGYIYRVHTFVFILFPKSVTSQRIGTHVFYLANEGNNVTKMCNRLQNLMNIVRNRM